MSVYLLRHGQTDWNKIGRVQGRTDVPLNDEGRRQADEARKILESVPFIRCYVSPLIRAQETARIALAGKNVDVVLEPRLVEMAYGDYEGKDWTKGDYQRDRRVIGLRHHGGENYFDVAHRAYSFLDEIGEIARQGNILLVCHGGIARVINTYFIDEVDNDSFIDNICPNGGIRVYEYPKRNVPLRLDMPE